MISHIETWAEELYQTEKVLLLFAIEKKSQFTFDLLHWIAHVTKLLTALAHAPVADIRTCEELEKHAGWLISVISWVPDDQTSTGFLECFSITETLFDVALETHLRGSASVAESTRSVLIGWTFKAGRYPTGWGTLEQGLLALATLALRQEDLQLVPWLKAEITKRLGQEGAPDTEVLDRTARNLRRKAVSLRRREFEFNRIENAMSEIKQSKMKILLKELADLLSPHTAGECVRPDFF